MISSLDISIGGLTTAKKFTASDTSKCKGVDAKYGSSYNPRKIFIKNLIN